MITPIAFTKLVPSQRSTSQPIPPHTQIPASSVPKTAQPCEAPDQSGGRRPSVMAAVRYQSAAITVQVASSKDGKGTGSGSTSGVDIVDLGGPHPADVH